MGRRRSTLALVALAVVALVVAVVAVLVVSPSAEAPFGFPTTPCAACCDSIFGSAWVVVVPGVLMRLDPETLQATKTIAGVAETAELAEPKLVFTDDALWISGPGNGVVTRISGGKQTRDRPGITSIAADGGTVWVGIDEGYVTKIGAPVAARMRLGDVPVDIAAKDGTLWAAAYERAVKRLHPAHGRALATIKLPDRPVAIAAGAKLIAVAVGESAF